MSAINFFARKINDVCVCVCVKNKRNIYKTFIRVYCSYMMWTSNMIHLKLIIYTYNITLQLILKGIIIIIIIIIVIKDGRDTTVDTSENV